jgi:hypothetical protein
LTLCFKPPKESDAIITCNPYYNEDYNNETSTVGEGVGDMNKTNITSSDDIENHKQDQEFNDNVLIKL